METDLIIVGAGPAGLTAAMYAARAGTPLLLIEKGIPGGQMAATETVCNYPGFPEPVYGIDLAQKMEAHARTFGAEVHTADIQFISRNSGRFWLRADAGETYSCRALIIATGASAVKLEIPGELEYAGKGVSYCAVCDGPFFRNVEVAVVGGGDSAVEEAVYLTRFADKVHLIHRRDRLRALREIQEKAFAQPKIVIHWNRIPVKILGENGVTSLVIRSVIDGEEENLPVSGVFFYVGLNPNHIGGLDELVRMDSRGFIITDTSLACSTPGLFAAGDIRSKDLRQVSTAVGDGASAAYSAQHYLENLPNTVPAGT
ncbi:MAG TPA: thioredoxin-disulfide reductase [Desulfomonilaceae bacterium]|nr:thioredoxin-disulfide reductase [Desulfomonilaceae bacterium]